MFLSSRWGVPSYEIESLPTSEFIRQKCYWEGSKWGMGNDLLSMIMSQVLSIRTGKPPEANCFQWKDLAVARCGKVIRKLTNSSGSSVRRAFMPIIGALQSLKGKK